MPGRALTAAKATALDSRCGCRCLLRRRLPARLVRAGALLFWWLGRHGLPAQSSVAAIEILAVDPQRDQCRTKAIPNLTDGCTVSIDRAARHCAVVPLPARPAGLDLTLQRAAARKQGSHSRRLSIPRSRTSSRDHRNGPDTDPDGRDPKDHAAAGIHCRDAKVTPTHCFQSKRRKGGEPAQQSGEQEQARIRAETTRIGKLVFIRDPALRSYRDLLFSLPPCPQRVRVRFRPAPCP